MKLTLKIIILAIFVLNISKPVSAQNPLIPHVYAADPSAHVWPNDSNTLWLYTSHDEAGTNHYATMASYHVFSTKDMVNWTDHGRVLSVDDVDWAISHAWAIDAVYWKGKYYLVYCMKEKKSSLFKTGLAISDVPQGPFKNIGFIKGMDIEGQDPALFLDKGKPYLFWGLGGKCYASELSNDLLSLKKETFVELTDQLLEVFEGPWVHKYNNRYYLSYPALIKGAWPEDMRYAVSDNVLGPYNYQGVYIPQFNQQSETNHGSIVEFKGNWLAFYHAAWLSNGNNCTRNIMADYLFYNSDGTIKPITPTKEGINNGKHPKVNIFLEAENAPMQGGKLAETRVENSFGGYSDKGYVTGFDKRHNYLEVLVQVAHDLDANFKMCISADTDFKTNILIGKLTYPKGFYYKMGKTNGWEMVDLGMIHLKAGDNLIRIETLDNEKASVKIDYFVFELSFY